MNVVNKVFLIIFFFTACLFTVWWFQVYLEEEEVAREGLLSQTISKVRSVKVSRPGYGHSVLLKYEEGRWLMTEPLLDLGNPSLVDNLLKTLNGLKKRSVPAEIGSQRAEDLGFDPAQHILEIEYVDGGYDVLQVGHRDASSDFFIASLNGALVFLEPSIVSLIHRPVNSWRSERYHNFGVYVPEIKWESESGNSWSLARENAGYRFVEGYDGYLSKQSENLLASLLGASITDFGAPLPLNYEIPKFLGVLSLYRGGDVATVEVFSNAIISSEREYVLGISPRKLGLLLLDPQELASRQLFRFDANHIVSAIVKLGEEEYVFSRKSAGWRVRNDLSFHGPGTGEALISYEEEYLRPGVFEKFLEIIQSLESGENSITRPAREPDGLVALSISKKPNLKKAKLILCWWKSANGETFIANGDSSVAHKVQLSFEAGVRSLID